MKRAFTLIEVLISVFLLSIIVFVLSSSLEDLKKGYKRLFQNESQNAQNYAKKELMFKDILESTSIKLYYTRYFDMLFLETKNSLYNRDRAFVKYVVTQKNNRLLRLESSYEDSFPVRHDRLYQTDFNIIDEDLEEFKVSRPQDGNASSFLLVSMFFKSKAPLVFELPIINNISFAIIQPEAFR